CRQDQQPTEVQIAASPELLIGVAAPIAELGAAPAFHGADHRAATDLHVAATGKHERCARPLDEAVAHLDLPAPLDLDARLPTNDLAVLDDQLAATADPHRHPGRA